MITDFNNPNRPVIIGLDHGYVNIKMTHACFSTKSHILARPSRTIKKKRR